MTNTTDLVWHPTDDQATDTPAPPPAGFEYDTPMVADQWVDNSAFRVWGPGDDSTHWLWDGLRGWWVGVGSVDGPRCSPSDWDDSDEITGTAKADEVIRRWRLARLVEQGAITMEPIKQPEPETDQFEPLGTMPVVGDSVLISGHRGYVLADRSAHNLITVQLDAEVAPAAFTRSYFTDTATQTARRVYKRKPDTVSAPAPIAEPVAGPLKRDILTEAKTRLGIKDDQHGPAEHSFPLIAALWSEYLGVKVSPVDVSAMMILLKCARAKHGHGTFDTWLDIIGYSVCGQQMVDG